MSDKKITWKEPSKDEVDCALLVQRITPNVRYPDTAAATLDDLHAAANALGSEIVMAGTTQYVSDMEKIQDRIREAVGYTKGHYFHLAERVEALKASELTWLARCYDADIVGQQYYGLLTQALAVGLAECERLRGAVRDTAEARDIANARADAWKEQCQKSEAAESAASSAIGELNKLLAAETARAEKAEAEAERCREERDLGQSFIHATCRALGHTPPDDTERLAKEAVARIAELEQRLSALTAPVEGEPSESELVALCEPPMLGTSLGRSLQSVWRAGHAAGLAAAARDAEAAAKDAAVQAMHEPSAPRDLPRATDEELGELFDDTYDKAFREGAEADKAAREALTERVRREQCLVTRAVKSGRGFEVWGRGNGWNVMVGGKPMRVDVKTSDVARVLAEMLGEVGR
jgi:hypothetical protein